MNETWKDVKKRENVLKLAEEVLKLRKLQEQNVLELEKVVSTIESTNQKLRHYTWLLENELEEGGEKNEVKQHQEFARVKKYKHPQARTDDRNQQS